MIIYKYLDRKGAKKTLEGNSVLLKTPNQFNDPYDCYYFADEKERQKAIDLAVNYVFFKELYQGAVVEGKQLALGKTNTAILKRI